MTLGHEAAATTSEPAAGVKKTPGLLQADVGKFLGSVLLSTWARWVAWGCVALAIAVAFALGAWLQSRVLINHDVGWIVRSAGWLLDGRRFGSEIVDSNPPLIWFLSIPAAAVARAGWLSEVDAIRIYFWAICGGSMLLCHRMLRPLRTGGGELESAGIILGAGVAFALLPQASFGQREYLAFVLALPYCLLVAGRVAYGDVFSRPLAITAGLLAGLAFAFKPWLLAVPVAIEAVHLIQTRDLRRSFRVETLALAGVLVTYALIAVVATPDYFTVSVPLARAVYWLFGSKPLDVMWHTFTQRLEPFLIAGLILACVGSFPAYARVLLAAALGFGANYWFQRKGFGYHLYPVLATSVVFLGYACAHGCKRIAMRRSLWLQRLAVPAIALLVAAGVVHLIAPVREGFAWARANDIRDGVNGAAWRRALIARLEPLTKGGGKRIYAISSHPFPAYPTLNYLDAEAGNSQLCLFAYSAYVKLGSVTDESKIRGIESGVATQRAIVLREFLSSPPDIVLVRNILPGRGRSGLDFIEHLSSDARFAAAWRNYTELKPQGQIRIFVRRQSAG